MLTRCSLHPIPCLYIWLPSSHSSRLLAMRPTRAATNTEMGHSETLALHPQTLASNSNLGTEGFMIAGHHQRVDQLCHAGPGVCPLLQPRATSIDAALWKEHDPDTLGRRMAPVLPSRQPAQAPGKSLVCLFSVCVFDFYILVLSPKMSKTSKPQLLEPASEHVVSAGQADALAVVDMHSSESLRSGCHSSSWRSQAKGSLGPSHSAFIVAVLDLWPCAGLLLK